MKREDIETHSTHMYGQHYPAINVKMYRGKDTCPPDVGDVVTKFGCSKATAERALQFAIDAAQEGFWEDVKSFANDVFLNYLRTPKVYSAGRSGGWLVVCGLLNIEQWNAVNLGKWAKFEKGVKRSMKWYLSKEHIFEDIESNRWAEEGSEAYNYVDEHDGSKCIVDLKAAAKEAGFGSIVR
jgi:hypothetical protein